MYTFAQTDNVNLVNQDLAHIDMRFKENEMVAHHGKSSFMLLGSRPALRAAIDTNIDIYRQDQRLNEVDSYEYLGVYVDRNLSWDYHMNISAREYIQS